ncbi:hypothetical protein H0H92_005902 [Tricholoma furcatifolium]|nr:hypothetical protein H0H92_005902 [Tricholoma furcatifolium]
MLFSTIVSIVSLSIYPVLAAPVPRHLRRATSDSSGWPSTSDPTEAKTAFGASGAWEDSWIQTVDNAPTLVGTYPAGSYAGSKDPGGGGFVFEATGGVNLTNAKEVTLSYSVQFPSGFNFVKGGKMPGLYGGTTPEIAKTCSGGRHNNDCWSGRLMWRQEGEGELYAYLPTFNTGFTEDGTYGDSIDRGNIHFTAGQWTQLTEIVTLNDVNGSSASKNGQIQVLQDGKAVITVPNLELRSTSEGRIVGVMMHTFFGGSSSTEYATPTDQKAYFKNFTVSVTQTL